MILQKVLLFLTLVNFNSSNDNESYPGSAELSVYQNIVKSLQELNISNNLNHLKIKFHSDLAPFLKKVLKKIDDHSTVLIFLSPTALLYKGSGTTHLLENYLSPSYSKIISNSLKTFYVLSLYYYLIKNSGSKRLPFKEIILLLMGHWFIVILDSKLL